MPRVSSVQKRILELRRQRTGLTRAITGRKHQLATQVLNQATTAKIHRQISRKAEQLATIDQEISRLASQQAR